ncbi:MAG: hypothetical protein D6722_12305 [Bacteroidetes bacterium]|nr:MAG: hypothetical protein D6722_12305 [Bacteroidota bacterium]
MGRYVLVLLSFVFAAALPAQPAAPADSAVERVRIRNATFLTFQRREGEEDVQKLIGKVHLEHDSTQFFCDSAYVFEQSNRFEAFSRVRVEMPDSVFLYCDRLSYDGDTRIAEVYDRITLTDQQSILTTDRLTYMRDEDYGFFRDGGKLVDDESVLTSVYGYYYPNEDMAYFKERVKLVHPDYTLTTDTLGYNTETKVATFLDSTLIVSEDGEIETSNGSYDTENSRVELFGRSLVKDSAYTLVADTLFYTDRTKLGTARGNILIRQEDSTLEIRGQYGTFNRETDESLVTDEAVGIQMFEDDTLYIFADTLLFLEETRLVWPKVDTLGAAPGDTLMADSSQALADSLGPPLPPALDTLAPAPLLLTPDSLAGPPPPPELIPDSVTVRQFKAFHQVRFFMNDMQGRADSMLYMFDDSLIYLYQDPVLWSDENQLSGDTIIVWLKNRKADSLWVGRNSFVVSREDTVGYNQLKGNTLRAKFRNNELVRLEMIGNAESIYFVRDDKDTVQVTYQGMNQALAQRMTIYLADNEVQKIVFRSKPEGTFHPFFEIYNQPNRLDGMQWRITERPERPQVFPVPEPAGLPPDEPEEEDADETIQIMLPTEGGQ